MTCHACGTVPEPGICAACGGAGCHSCAFRGTVQHREVCDDLARERAIRERDEAEAAWREPGDGEL